MRRAWFRGQVTDGDILLSAFDRGLTLGDGLFETVLVHRGIALWLDAHLARFKSSAAEIGINYPAEDIASSVAALCTGVDAHHVLRLTLTRGAAGRGLGADTDDYCYIATLQPFDAALLFQPVDLTLVSVCRNETSPASRLKTISYMDQILAAREAGEKNCDDGLMLNTKGHVASTTIGNVFLVKGDRLITPSRDQGILPGIMRDVVISLAAQAGFKVEERVVDAAELEQAEGLFVTNSLRFLRPVRRYAWQHYEPLIELLCAAAKVQSGADPRMT